MTPEERARQVCDAEWKNDQTLYPVVLAAIREAVAEEREACATILDAYGWRGQVLATDIRARTK